MAKNRSSTHSKAGWLKANIIKAYGEITKFAFEDLKNEEFDVILGVMVTLRANGKLPPFLKCEFPSLKNFSWFNEMGSSKSSLERDLKFAIARIVSAKSRLESLIVERNAFSRLLLLGHFEDAHRCLHKVESLYGVSLWLLEAKVLLAEQTGGVSALRDEIGRFYKHNPQHNVSFLFEYACQRVDRTMPMSAYQSRAVEMLNNSGFKEHDLALHTYISFMLRTINPIIDNISSNDVGYILRNESCRPIVDCYDSVCRLLPFMIANDDTRNLVRDIDSLRHFASIRDQDVWHIIKSVGKESLLSSAIPNGSETATSRTQEQDILSLAYYKNIAIHRSFDDLVGNEECLAGVVMQAVKKFLDYGNELPLAYLAFAKLSAMLGSTSLGYQLLGFVAQCVLHDTKRIRQQQFLSSRSKFDFSFPLIGNAVDLVAGCVQDFAVPAILDGRNIADVSSTIFYKLVNAQDLVCRREYASALALLEPLLEVDDMPPYVHAEALRSTYDCYINTGLIGRAAQVISDTRVNLIGIFYLVNIGTLISAYTLTPSDEIDHSCIAWPNVHMLGYYFSGLRMRSVYSVYANFMRSNGYRRPHEIVESKHRFKDNSVLFFLQHVCSIELMQSDWVSFSALPEVEGERISILHQLQAMDPSNDVEYAKEISGIQQSIAIRQVRKAVSESKIYFNIEGVIKSLPKDTIESFNRYRLYRDLSIQERKLPAQAWATRDNAIVTLIDGASLQFQSLFNSIYSTILYSNEHGLNTFLSVRIRHQTLMGALRSVYDRVNLIGEQAKGQYRPNSYWRENFSEEAYNIAFIERQIELLSAEVDSIVDRASSHWIRINHSGEHPDGWFDLCMEEREYEEVMSAVGDTNGYDEFLDRCISYISNKLQNVLENVRSKVRTQLGAMLLESLDGFAERLQSQAAERIPPELFASITKCRTGLQNKLGEIEGWFQLQDKLSVQSFALDTLLKASIENVKSCFSSSRFRCEYDNIDSTEIAGKYFPHLWDILFIVLENIVTHSEATSNTTSIETSNDGRTLVLTIVNQLPSDKQEDEIREELMQVAMKEPSIVQKEKGSGLPKIRNSLESNLGITGDSMVATVDARAFRVTLSLPLSIVQGEGVV
jgi:hypothetical protein